MMHQITLSKRRTFRITFKENSHVYNEEAALEKLLTMFERAGYDFVRLDEIEG